MIPYTVTSSSNQILSKNVEKKYFKTGVFLLPAHESVYERVRKVNEVEILSSVVRVGRLSSCSVTPSGTMMGAEEGCLLQEGEGSHGEH